MKPNQLLETLIENILQIQHDRPILVAIDGVDAAGKSILAKGLAEKLRAVGASVIEASIDGFHNPRAIRYKKGADSPEGYYRDSFNIAALKIMLLDPLKTGDLRYKARAFDYTIDMGIISPIEVAESHTILVFDGVFSHQQGLTAYYKSLNTLVPHHTRSACE